MSVRYPIRRGPSKYSALTMGNASELTFCSTLCTTFEDSRVTSSARASPVRVLAGATGNAGIDLRGGVAPSSCGRLRGIGLGGASAGCSGVGRSEIGGGCEVEMGGICSIDASSIAIVDSGLPPTLLNACI